VAVRLLEAAQLPQHIAEIVVRLDRLRLQLDRPAAMLEGFLRMIVLEQHLPEIASCHRQVRPQLDGPAKLRHGAAAIAENAEGIAEIVVGDSEPRPETDDHTEQVCRICGSALRHAQQA